MSFQVFAQHPQKPDTHNSSWRLFQKAESEFAAGQYGKAISLCQDAKQIRRDESDWTDYVMRTALNAYQVRHVGDNIDAVISILKERENYDALDIIQSLIDKKSADFFDNSISRLHEYLIQLKDYPEADFLLAKIYRVEGEYEFAMNFLEEARIHSDILDIPDMKYDILYEMAEVADVQKKKDVYEKCLLLVVSNDGFYKDETLKKAFLRTINSHKSDSVDRFFMLYRVDAHNSIKAYLKLSDFYDDENKISESLLMDCYGVLASFTNILSILQERNPDYSYDTLEGFLKECRKWDDICQWCNMAGIWKGFFQFAKKCALSKAEYFSAGLFKLMAGFCPEEYWARASEEYIENEINRKYADPLAE